MVSIENIFRVETGQGFWTPLVWVIAIIIAFLVMYILRNFGNKSYKKDTEQAKAFLSGNKEYSAQYMHIKSSNLYWGFTKSMESLYTLLKKMHNGNVSDYVLWFVIILAIFLLVEVI